LDLSGSQQQLERGSRAQQALAAWFAAFVEQADASPAADSVPTIAARAIPPDQTQ
jgi:hypothetical protein